MTRKIRPIRIEGNVAYVPLTQGYEAVIDASDADAGGMANWFAKIDNRTIYALTNDCSGAKTRQVSLHRFLLGEPHCMEVDHIDCDGLNNRLSNLLEANRPENARNRRLNRNSTSGYKGVTPEGRLGKWRARIKINGTKYSLGCWPTPEAAHAAYVEASARLHGEFGRAT